MGNFVNITYSLAMRHQLYHCYLSINSEELPGWEYNVEAGPGLQHLCIATDVF